MHSCCQALQVRHVSYEPRDGVASDSSYTGPVYDELDETLQAEFAGYLAARGINEEVRIFCVLSKRYYQRTSLLLRGFLCDAS